MTGIVRRAGAFAGVGSIALLTPVFDQYADLAPLVIVVFLAVAGLAAFVIEDGPLFELFARPGDHEDGRLYGLAGFSLSAAALAFLSTLPMFDLPVFVFVGAVLLLSFGNLGDALVRSRTDTPILAVVGFGVLGTVAAAAGMLLTSEFTLSGSVSLPAVVFLAASGTLLGALLRSVLFARDDPLVMLSAGLLLWFLSMLTSPLTLVGVLAALAVTLAIGYVSYALEAASIPGMLTGVFFSLLTIVLGGAAWFLILIAFFGVGALATKYHYEEKLDRGIAEENDGARGSANVLGNSAVALGALLAYAGSPDLVSANPELFRLAYAGALSTALADTLSSELGGVYDNPRLITTFERVEPGTDGGVTWQGILAAALGGSIVGAIVYGLFPTGATGTLAVVAAGVIGMFVDSLLGATLENKVLSNQMVNFSATLAGALVGAAAAFFFVI